MLLWNGHYNFESIDAEKVYISTGATGLYEKYGYSFCQMMKDMHGEDSRVYTREFT